MNLFESTLTLDKKIGVIIPKMDGLEKPYIERFKLMFASMFGGSSETTLSGYYVMNDDSGLAKDENVFIYAWYGEMTEQQEIDIACLIKEMKVALNQECIGIEYDGKFTMVF